MILHTFHPTSIAFQAGAIQIHWYGIFISLGVLLGLLVALKIGKKYNVGSNEIFDLAFYSLIFGIIGARIFYVLYNFSYFKLHWVEIFKVWQGGVASHGMLLFGFLTIWLYCKIKKLNLGLIFDLAFTSLVFGQFIGRWGNYFNQELFGRPTSLPWGIPIDPINRPAIFENYQYFHPAFLYESIYCLAIFFFLLYLWNRRSKIQPDKIKYGAIALAYFFLYSCFRFGIEFIRVDSVPVFLHLRIMQWFSLAIILSCILVYLYYYRRKKV